MACFIALQNNDVGMKTVYYGKKILVEQEDAELFKVGENVTFINWGNLTIKNVKRWVIDISVLQSAWNRDGLDILYTLGN